jgi:hypothetical protein
MPAQIQRTSGPQPLREQADGEFTWTIPLSAIPSREWLKLFNTPLEPNEVFMPSRVDFRDRGLVFASREERITEWLKHIDQWIATANEGVAEAAERGSHEREREQRGEAADLRRRQVPEPLTARARSPGQATAAWPGEVTAERR